MSGDELGPQAGLEPAISLGFSTNTRLCLVEAVLDLALTGEVIGLEVLYLSSQCGGCVRVPSMASVAAARAISIAIDPASDAMYVRIAEGTSSSQVVKVAVISIDRDDTINGICVP